LATNKTADTTIQYDSKTETKVEEIYTITDIDNWQNPVKTLFENYSITLKKVELLKNKTYPIFYLEYGGELLSECDYYSLLNIAKANGYWSYKLVGEEDKISVEVDCDRNNKKLLKATIYRQEANGDKTDTKKDIYEYHVYENNHNKLNNKDFDVTISGLHITKDMGINAVTDQIGTGTASENNNYGYIGRSLDGHDRNGYGYNENNVNYNLISFDECDLERIDIDSTVRGLHYGDSKNKLVALYGNPNFEILSDMDRTSDYIYSYNDKQFVVGIRDNKIVGISLQFMNLYEF
jgi:hypothetical protein